LTGYLRRHRHGTDTLEHWLRRTEVTWDQVVAMHPEVRSLGTPPDALEQVVLEAKYAGYIGRQAAQVERFQKLESKPIPAHFDFAAVPQLRAEAKEKLRPASLGQASRISGISPADLAVLLIYLG
jgi:tRNA uridine 5-carboxymethylaminomethyl modification enzyme